MNANWPESAGKFERIPAVVFPEALEAARRAAREIATLIRAKQALGQAAVLGLATGSTPIPVYRELVRMHREEGLHFDNVITFNLDEYYPMPAESPRSYRHYMTEHLFQWVDIPAHQIHIPDGTAPAARIVEYCAAYERAIQAAGGIDLQILGLGRTGHIGFNEPGSPRKSATRLIKLDDVTRGDAAHDFQGLDNVPRQALTMGIRTILSARRIILLAFGEHKAPMVRAAVEGEPTPAVTASFLQEHEAVAAYLDPAAARDLTRVKTPWLAGSLADFGLAWDALMVRRAAVWLAFHLRKPILKLTDSDYNENGLHELLNEQGSAYGINLHVFRYLQRTITGWPGGKPDGGRYPKRVLVISPFPDSAFIAMGGTLQRLIAQGHTVRLAVLASGANSVSDETARRYLDFLQDAASLTGQTGALTPTGLAALDRDMESGSSDSSGLAAFKGVIRMGEAKAAARLSGLPPASLCFLQLPFFAAQRSVRGPVTAGDVEALAACLAEFQPDQVYVPGGRSDPLGTFRLTQEIFEAAWQRTLAGDPCVGESREVWLYRRPEQEWPIPEIGQAVPLSPDELSSKVKAICQHYSQRAMRPAGIGGHREAWQQAEAANRGTAAAYDQLGLAEYEAIEAFQRWPTGLGDNSAPTTGAGANAPEPSTV